MKKLLFLLFALVTVTMQAQTANGSETEFEAVKTTNPQTVSTSQNVVSVGADGTNGKVAGENITTTHTPSNYSPANTTLKAQIAAIDLKLGQIGNTTAGITNRIYFTGDNITVTAGTFFASNGSGKGTATSGLPTPLVNGDNQKQYFTKDLISIAQPSATTAPPGVYSGQLTVSSTPTPNGTQQRYAIEIYKTNNGGTPIASGITGAPTGNLGVTVVAILDSGLINLVAGAITNIGVSGTLASTLSLATGERLRYHVSAQKVGTGGGNVTMSVLYGSDYNSFYDVTVSQKTSTVINDSGVSGLTASDALNNLNTIKANDSNVIHTTGDETKNGNLGVDNLILKPNGMNGSSFRISQEMAVNDAWSIYGKYSTSEQGEMVIEVGDNAIPFSSGGQRFRFHYDNASSGTAKDPFIIDYNTSTFDTDLVLNGATASTIASFDASKNIKSLPLSTYPSLSELAFLKGVTSAVQTQLNGKQATLTNPITGTGTPNYLSKFTGSTTQSNSLVFDNGSVVGIGTSTPVAGVVLSLNSATGGNLAFKSADVTKWIFGTYSGESTSNYNFYNSDLNSIAMSINVANNNIKIPNLAGTNTRMTLSQPDGTQIAGDVAPTSGTYTPTLTNTTNVTSASLLSAIYTRVGDIVTVYMAVTVNITSASTLSTITATLPINRVSTSNTHSGSGSAAGNAFTNSVPCFYVLPSNTTSISITFIPTATGAYTVSGSFSYKAT